MDHIEEHKPRLGVEDKRHLFQTLLAMIERLFYLNKFPVDQEDFALSLQPPSEEAAWRLLLQNHKKSLRPNNHQYFTCVNNIKWLLHLYPEEEHPRSTQAIFMDVPTTNINNARRHLIDVNSWCATQTRLEEQMLRSIKVIKAIVHSCNTVGQYKRVSPDLLGFLPSQYRDALGAYTKQSPYPAITVEPEEIETTLSTLAYAALQSAHSSEENYTSRPKWQHNRYSLTNFPRSKEYAQNKVRQLEL